MEILQELLLIFVNDPVGSSLWLFLNGGWIVLVLLFLYLAGYLYVFYMQGKYIGGLKWHLLAIDIPREEGVPHLKKVENFFATLLGAHGSITIVEKYLEGELQQWFSFEIVSIDGYVQFMVRTTDKYKELVEAAVYAQWPNAEITEIEDYTEKIPADIPNEDWKSFSMEWVNVAPEAYPIRTYRNYEHTLSQTFADPLGTILETFSRGKPGEQFWYQIIITPISESWKKEGRKVVKKLIGAPVEEKATFIDKLLGPIWKAVYGVVQEIFATGDLEEKKENKPRSEMIFLSPGEQEVVKGVEEKLTKIGYKTKIRFVYMGRPDVFDKTRAANPMIGAIKQTNTMDMNALKPYGPTVTKVQYFFPKTRTNRRIRNNLAWYKSRSNSMGAPAWVMNIEELATLWHFPTEEFTLAPIGQVEAKKAAPPSSLPTAEPPTPAEPQVKRGGAARKKATPPEELPFV